MLSSFLHNTIQSSTLLDRIQTQGARLRDHCPQFSWTTKLLLEDETGPVGGLGKRTGDLKQEWNTEIETFIIEDKRNEESSQSPAVSTRESCEDFPLFVPNIDDAVDDEETERIKIQKDLVFQEMAERNKIRIKWQLVTKEFLAEVSKRQRYRRKKGKKTTDEFLPTKRVPVAFENSLLNSLEEFYTKFDMVVADLEDRHELVEIEEFKQLVIQDLSDRSEALQEFKKKLPTVLQELMQKVVIIDLKHEGLLPSVRKATKPLLCDEWIEIADGQAILDESDWIVCDDL